MSNEQGLSGEYLVRVNGSGDWLTAVLGLLYGNEEHKRRAEECEGQKSAAKEQEGEEEGESRHCQREDSPPLIYCAGRNCSVSWRKKEKQKEFSLSALEMTV